MTSAVPARTEEAGPRGAGGEARLLAMPAPVETLLIQAHGLAALVTLLLSVLFGIVMSIQLLAPDITGSAPWLGWGRLRYAHTQGIMLGWLGNAFFAFLYHALPTLTGRVVTSAHLGRWLFGLWNFAIVAPGWVLVLAGFSQPLEWAEFPLIIDAIVVIALALAVIQFVPPFFRRGPEYLYVSGWYIVAGLIFTLFAYPMGNLVPELVPGARGAAFSGLWIHDAIGLFVTPLALAIIYYVIPAATRRPIYSHALSMVGFWLLLFVYPLNGTHHYVFSVIPMEAQRVAIAASSLLGVDVLIVVGNLLLSLRGAGLFPRDVGLRFVSMATVFYLLVSIQGALQAQMSINRAVHFSDWVVGHAHLAMLGFATFAAAGGLIHAWQRLPHARYNARALRHAFWLLFAGVILMVSALTLAGLAEARAWQSDAPWLESVRAARPYWIARALSAIPLAGGFIALLVGLSTGPRGGGLQAIATDDGAVAPVAPVVPIAPVASIGQVAPVAPVAQAAPVGYAAPPARVALGAPGADLRAAAAAAAVPETAHADPHPHPHAAAEAASATAPPSAPVPARPPTEAS